MLKGFSCLFCHNFWSYLVDKQTGEGIALVKALGKRRAFYILLMDLMKIRLCNIQTESHKTIKNKWQNIWDKKIPQDKQLELPFQDILPRSSALTVATFVSVVE